MKLSKRKTVQVIFSITLVFKAIDGILETVGGLLLSTVTSGQLNRWVRFLTQHEIDNDADDVIVRFFIHAIQHRSASTKTFATVFLIGHGAVKAGLVVALMKKYRWAYPIAIAVFGTFLIYQSYRFALTHAIWLLALSVIDTFVILLTLIEFRRLRTSG